MRKDPIDVRSFSMDSSRDCGVVTGVLAGDPGDTPLWLDDVIKS